MLSRSLVLRTPEVRKDWRFGKRRLSGLVADIAALYTTTAMRPSQLAVEWALSASIASCATPAREAPSSALNVARI